MSKQTLKQMVLMGATIPALLMIAVLGGCTIVPSTDKPKEESPAEVGFYTSPYDSLTSGKMDCKAYLMNFHGNTYISSTESHEISSYMSPCQIQFLMGQPESTRLLVAQLVSSKSESDPRMTVVMSDNEDGHTLIKLRNESMNIDLYLNNDVKSVLGRAKKLSDGTYDRQKLDQSVPDYVNQLASYLVSSGYKFNGETPGELRFESGSLNASTGYNTAVIFFGGKIAKPSKSGTVNHIQ